MRGKRAILASLVILANAALAFYVSAQSQNQPRNNQDSVKTLESKIGSLEVKIADMERRISNLENPTPRVHPVKQ